MRDLGRLRSPEREKLSHMAFDPPRKTFTPPETKSKETEREETTESLLGLFGTNLFIHPGKLRPREKKALANLTEK